MPRGHSVDDGVAKLSKLAPRGFKHALAIEAWITRLRGHKQTCDCQRMRSSCLTRLCFVSLSPNGVTRPQDIYPRVVGKPRQFETFYHPSVVVWREREHRMPCRRDLLSCDVTLRSHLEDSLENPVASTVLINFALIL
ncbi:hypothetical protein Ae201684_006835 [Aphanomyces euteiches]|uniref:Uncharacterized protein n=1 Tax=Aphanomyces euteiches TaxID=100861 RepID=A0A6G0XA79_9STRA|nr:hypothetical protein Ae201684_006835 [Aphanomyces euteiches]